MLMCVIFECGSLFERVSWRFFRGKGDIKFPFFTVLCSSSFSGLAVLFYCVFSCLVNIFDVIVQLDMETGVKRLIIINADKGICALEAL